MSLAGGGVGTHTKFFGIYTRGFCGGAEFPGPRLKQFDTQTRTRSYTHTHTHTHIHTHTHMHAFTHTCTHSHMHAHSGLLCTRLGHPHRSPNRICGDRHWAAHGVLCGRPMPWRPGAGGRGGAHTLPGLPPRAACCKRPHVLKTLLSASTFWWTSPSGAACCKRFHVLLWIRAGICATAAHVRVCVLCVCVLCVYVCVCIETCCNWASNGQSS